jgi:hypothetical protein
MAMARFFAGAAAMLLLVTAAFFWWKSGAGAQSVIPPAPEATASPEPLPPLADPPRATERTREEKRFDRYDKDRDERITRDEYLATRRKAYAKLDTNGDGRLSFDEWAIRTTGKFAKADADRSASLDRAEFLTTRVIRKTPARRDCPPVRLPADDE